LKFKLGENMPANLTTWLREQGEDVSNIHEESLVGEDDPPVLEAALSEGRTFLTFDLDFADVRNYPPGTHCGIVVFRLRDQRWKTLHRPVCRLFEEGTLEKLQDGLAIVDETRVRWKRAKKK
jgi:predicted nuclease of predicted toxin-antitoxin system